MGKDGAGGIGGSTSSCGGSCRCKPATETPTSNTHIATLAIIDRELTRLHEDMRIGNGDDDVTQEMISNLHDELIRLSESLSDV